MFVKSKDIPHLSVIIPVYNVETYLEEALDSVLNQSFKNIEVITVNDGSTDKSGIILDEYEKKNQRLTVYHRQNYGLSATRNFGFKKAKGAYIYFLDSDDCIANGAFEDVMRLAADTSSDIICLSSKYIDEYGRVMEKKTPKIRPDYQIPVSGENLFVELMKSKSYSSTVSSYIFKKSFLKELQISFDEGFIHEDEAFTAIALCSTDCVTSKSCCYYLHRLRSNSIMSQKKGEKNIIGWTKAVSNILSFINSRNLNEDTVEMLLVRVRILANNSIGVINKLNSEQGSILHLHNYLDKDEISKLGMAIKLKSKFPIFYKIYRAINH